MAAMQLLEPEVYYQALVESIPQAKKRVMLTAMVLLWGGEIAVLLELLLAAARRGVKVTVLLDVYSSVPYLYGIKNGKPRWQKTELALQELQAAGGRVFQVGRLGAVPYRGRYHVKATVIDDDAYSFGGINLRDGDFHRTDYMLHTRSAEYADCLMQLVERVGRAKKPIMPNGEVQLESKATVLFDGGRPHDSIIYQRACELAAQATRAYFVSHMAPSGALAKLLTEIDALTYTSEPDQLSGPAAWGQAFDLQRFHTPNRYRGKQQLHAKFILFELPGGRKALLSGSHNFTYRSTVYGTKEIALYSTDTKLWDQLHEFIQKHIDKGTAA